MLLAFFGVIGLTWYLFQKVPKGFIPDQDTDQISLQMLAAQGTSFYKMMDYQKSVADIVSRDPNVDTFMASVGGGFGGQAGNNAMMNIILKPRSERTMTMQQVMDKLRPQIARFPGFQTFMRIPPTINIGTRGSRAAYELTIQSADTEALARESQKLQAAVEKESDIVADVNTDLQIKSPRVNVVVNRDRAAALGLDVTSIEGALYAGYGPKWSTTIYAPTNQYEVLMEIQQKYQAFSDYLSKIYFKTNTGGLVPLNEVVSIREDAMASSINHTSVLPSVTISFNTKDGVSLGEAVERLGAVAARTLPDTMRVSFTGTAAVFQDSLKNLTLLMIVAIGVVYIVLGVLYESYIHPITILSGLPSAGVGALLTLIIFKVELNIYSFVGLVMLVGLVKKNAIMQIDFALEQERKLGKSSAEAIYEGCLIRFRPIMMTTWAALLGAVPMALGYGSGGEARRPLGLAVCGGLVVSQMMTLYLTPVVYTYMSSMLEWWRKRHPDELEMEPEYQFGD